MKVLSLGGAGAVCQHATRDLAESSDFQIVIGDYDTSAAERLAAEIDDPRIQVQRVDAADYDGMVTLFREFDVILNGLPWEYDLAVTKACVEVGVGFVSITESMDFTTSWGKLTLAVLGSLAEIYIDKWSAETSKGKRGRARKGLSNASHAPYGYTRTEDARSGGRDEFMVDPESAEVVAVAFESYAGGQYSDIRLAHR